MRSLYGEHPFANANYYIWRYLENPWKAGGLFAAFDESEHAIGLLGWSAGKLRIGSTEHLSGLVGDAATRPEVRHVLFRQEGSLHSIFTLLYASAEQGARSAGLDALFAFPNAMSAPFFVRRFGYREIGRLDTFVIPLRPLTLLRSRGFHVPFWEPLDQVAGALLRIRPGSGRRQADVTWSPQSAVDVDALESRTKRSGRSVLHVRDGLFAGWRFGRRPFRVAAVRDDLGLAGAVTVLEESRTARDTPLRLLLICDLLVTNDSDAIPLLRSAVEAASVGQCAAVVAIGSFPPGISKGFWRAGAFKVRSSLIGREWPIVFKALRDMPDPSDGPWLITLSDNDVI